MLSLMRLVQRIETKVTVFFKGLPRREFQAFVFCYLSFCLLALLALSEAGQPNKMDAAVAHSAYGISGLRADWCRQITKLGDGHIIRIGCAFSILLLMFLRKWHYVPALLIGVFGEMELTREIQKIIGRVRPDFPDIPRINSFGYPSGHTGAAAALYGFWIIFVLREYRAKAISSPFIIVLALVALSVGISRIFLLAHWATDVIGGFCFAIAWILLCFWVNEWMHTQPNDEPRSV